MWHAPGLSPSCTEVQPVSSCTACATLPTAVLQTNRRNAGRLFPTGERCELYGCAPPGRTLSRFAVELAVVRLATVAGSHNVLTRLRGRSGS